MRDRKNMEFLFSMILLLLQEHVCKYITSHSAKYFEIHKPPPHT